MKSQFFRQNPTGWSLDSRFRYQLHRINTLIYLARPKNVLAVGTYTGGVTFTSSAVSNSPISLPVSLTVTSQPTLPPLEFCLVVFDRQSHGTEWLLLDGTGSVNSSGQAHR